MTPYQLGAPTTTLAAVAAAMCLFAGTCTAQSSEPEASRIRISGFGTFGLVRSQAPEGWSFLRSVEQPSSSRTTHLDVDSRLGIQMNYAASSQIELVAQLLATRRASDAPAGDAVEWAFAAYRPTADLTLRAGRLNLDQFVMSDYRNVGFAYLYARPPVEYYGTIPSNLDGADLSRTWNLEDAHWRAKGFVGRSKSVGVPITNVFGFALSRESDGLLLRAGWTHAKFVRNYSGLSPLLDGLDQVQALPVPAVSAEAAALRSNLDFTSGPLTYATLGLTYELAQWQYAAELMRITVGHSKLRGGYASIGRRIGEFTLFGMVSDINDGAAAVATPAWVASLAPIIGSAAAQQAQVLGSTSAYVANQSARQTTYSLGGRWDVHPRMALKVQWDHVKIKANGGYLWANSTSDAGRANIATVLLDFVF